MPLTHSEKIEKFMDESLKKGISPYTAGPPLFRMIWAFGFKIKPPLFMNFMELVVLEGALFGVGFFLLGRMSIYALMNPYMTVATTAIGSAIAGAVFGVSIALVYRKIAKKMKLSSWEEYSRNESIISDQWSK